MSEEEKKDFVYYIKLIGVIAATVTATSALWAAYPRDYWIAHRGYVNATVTEKLAPIVPTVNELARWQIEDALAKLEAEAATWKIKLPSEADPAIRDMIQKRINDVTGQMVEMRLKANELKGIGPGHR